MAAFAMKTCVAFGMTENVDQWMLIVKMATILRQILELQSHNCNVAMTSLQGSVEKELEEQETYNIAQNYANEVK
jgi:hypothetical protein